MNSNNFVQSNDVIYKLICIMKKKNKDILSVFTIEISFNVDEVTFDDNEDVQMKKSMKNNNIIKLIKNDNTVLSMKNSDIIKSINYNDFMNMTSEFFTHMIID